ncbi:c6.3 [Ichnoviriform fugitivi]|uniref:C6.3 n=1 Tax=Ichnoviriform fugitivi TaxID=265522 RepID=A2Q0H0_9VIRU|nr:c6.3 [Ichnoviriform fugitivi]BAF45685.1 c6.3 [Ichnoviriform fugitivi]
MMRILLLILVHTSVAAGAPLTKPPPSEPKPSQISTPEMIIQIKVTITAVGPSTTFVPTATTPVRAKSRKQLSQKRQKMSTQNPSSWCSQNSTELFSDNSTDQFCQNFSQLTQVSQNYTKEFGYNSSEQFSQSPTNLSSQHSTKHFKQNPAKASSEKSQKQPSAIRVETTALKPHRINWKHLPSHMLS